MVKRVSTQVVIQAMWATGRPTTDDKFANLYRAALKAGLNERQAIAITNEAYDAEKLSEWALPQGSALHQATQQRHAEEHPNGKCAEDLAAIREGRPSRWGTLEFHRGVG